MIQFTLESENEFSKIYKGENQAVYFNKAYDEDSDVHFIIASIPEITEAKVADVKFPLAFASEEERNQNFSDINEEFTCKFFDDLKNHIISQNQKPQE